MPSPADDCWRLSADCSHWAAESRDTAARRAFRQMATAWAGLAFSQDFVSATLEPVDLLSSDSSQAAPVESISSPNSENEKTISVSNPGANEAEQTTRASTSDLTSSESSQAAPAENVASSSNGETCLSATPAVKTEKLERTTRPVTNKPSGQRNRLSLPSPIRFPKR
jgi:hypothetical protein